jgi:protein HIRA/HIR1
MTRSGDGYSLFACTYDGNVVAVKFTPEDIGTPLSEEEKYRALSKYGFQRNKQAVVENPIQLQLERQLNQIEHEERLMSLGVPAPSPVILKPSAPAPTKTVQQQQTVTITKDGKKRITPVFLSRYCSL